jgi:hypothetical protein
MGRTTRGRARAAIATIGIAALAAGAVLSAPLDAIAAGNTLSLNPATKSVTSGTTFTVTVVGTTSGTVGGTSASVTFDKTLLHVTAIAKGADWTGAGAIWAGWPTPVNMTTYLTTANGAGKVPLIGAALLTGSLPAGAHTLYTITFQAVAPGSAVVGLPIGPVDGAMIDGTGGTITVTTVSPSACTSPGASCAGVYTLAQGSGATPTPAPTKTAAPKHTKGPKLPPTDLSGPSAIPGFDIQSFIGSLLLGIAGASLLLFVMIPAFELLPRGRSGRSSRR